MSNAHLVCPLSRSIEDVRMELNDSATVYSLNSPHMLRLSRKLDSLLNQYENLSNTQT
ncbi:aspartyl-phosphate phosphatase Spo0E family protein [Shouchella sp. JSM 1781072]|uniref:aspartyl-phosphate phosphatase Spo0E family protein n=1 Tax=Shouchella sp. JSM 1781072 TaxID=3344581 RepID=UPI0035BF7DBF